MKLYTSLLLFFFVIPSAHAYIDPGSGSFMLQMFIASLIGASFTVKAYYRAIKERVMRFFGKSTAEETEQNAKHPQE